MYTKLYLSCAWEVLILNPLDYMMKTAGDIVSVFIC